MSGYASARALRGDNQYAQAGEVDGFALYALGGRRRAEPLTAVDITQLSLVHKFVDREGRGWLVGEERQELLFLFETLAFSPFYPHQAT